MASNKDSFPLVELRVRALGEQVTSLLALHAEEVERHVQQGIERAIADAPEGIIKMAREEASKQIASAVQAYFSWGPGQDIIRDAVARGMEPVRKALLGKQA